MKPGGGAPSLPEPEPSATLPGGRRRVTCVPPHDPHRTAQADAGSRAWTLSATARA